MVKFTNDSYLYPIAIDDLGPRETGCTYFSVTGDNNSWVALGTGTAYDYDVALRVRTSSFSNILSAFSDDGHCTHCNSFSDYGTEHTVYTYCGDLLPSHGYKVAYYDGSDTKRVTDSVTSGASGNVSSQHTFAEEIDARNMPALRKFFYSLYPIIGLEDPFLSGLFHQELSSQNYRGIAQEYDVKVAQAIDDIEAVEEKGRFMEGLEAIAREMASFCTDMITQTSVQSALAEIINRELNKDEDTD